MTDNQNLHEIAKDLQAATAQLGTLEMKEGAARRDTTNQRNEVNRLQKQFDEKVKELKAGAPHDSDWGYAGRKPVGL